MGCTAWYSVEFPDCPVCGLERPAYNPHLHTAKLNDHLYGMASAAMSEEQRYQESLAEEVRMAKRFGIKPAPMKPAAFTDEEKQQLAHKPAKPAV